MDIKPSDQNPVTDDQELAKVLAGMHNEPGQLPAPRAGEQNVNAPAGLQFEETTPAVATDTAAPQPPTEEPVASDPAPLPPPPADEPPAIPTMPAGDDELEGIKKDALEELRPLVSKLNLPAEEKFDTMLLIIRSTDDKSLLKPAHEAAKAIEDEQKRATALLDIVKEIDYFASHNHVAS